MYELSADKKERKKKDHRSLNLEHFGTKMGTFKSASVDVLLKCILLGAACGL